MAEQQERWYLRNLDDGMIYGPMSRGRVEARLAEMDGTPVLFSEDIFNVQFVLDQQTDELVKGLRCIAGRLLAELKKKEGYTETDALADQLAYSSLQAADFLVLLSAKKVVRGSIEGGSLTLDEVSPGVEVDIRDYDTDGCDGDDLEEDEHGAHFQAG